MRRFLIASALIFGVFAPTADAQGVVARYRGGPGAGFGFYGPAYRTPGYLVPPPYLPSTMAVVPIGPPVVRPGSYRDPLYRYRGVAPIGPAIPVLPYPPAPRSLLPRPWLRALESAELKSTRPVSASAFPALCLIRWSRLIRLRVPTHPIR